MKLAEDIEACPQCDHFRPADSPSPAHRKVPLENGSHWGRMCLFWTVSALAVWGFLDGSRRAFESIEASLKTARPNCWCGSTDAEAMAMGCRYDQIAVDWLPEYCIDNDLVAEFDASGPDANGSWPYFEPITMFGSENETDFVRIDNAEIDSFAREGRGYYATREWHVLHCMFTWRKQFRARFQAEKVEPWNNHEGHIKHCSEYIISAVKWRLEADVVETHILGVNRHVPSGEE